MQCCDRGYEVRFRDMWGPANRDVLGDWGPGGNTSEMNSAFAVARSRWWVFPLTRGSLQENQIPN